MLSGFVIWRYSLPLCGRDAIESTMEDDCQFYRCSSVFYSFSIAYANLMSFTSTGSKLILHLQKDIALVPSVELSSHFQFHGFQGSFWFRTFPLFLITFGSIQLDSSHCTSPVNFVSQTISFIVLGPAWLEASDPVRFASSRIAAHMWNHCSRVKV